MTFEIKNLFDYILNNQEDNYVLATVVLLDGSSYRKPGVRMIISSSNKTYGNISGGCVEKDIIIKSKKVFDSNIPRIIKYDGTLRLGCEGILTILLEPINLEENFLKNFYSSINNRKNIIFKSYFINEEISSKTFGSIIEIQNKTFKLRNSFKIKDDKEIQKYTQKLYPIFKLLIFGAEHDSVELCKIASILGWQVTIIAPPDEDKSIDFFNGASFFLNPTYDKINPDIVDNNCAVIIMSHSFNRDIQYLLALKETFPQYFGILGPKKRKERVLEKFLELYPDCSIKFLEQIKGPVGLNIGSETAAEISISIISEILKIIRNMDGISLSKKVKRIHD